MTKSVLTLLLCLPLTVLAGPHAIVIHGGAGTILRDNMSAEVEAEYRSTLTKAVTAGHQVLAGGGNSSDAVIQAVLILEDSPLFNAGRGAVFTNAGQVELDASIMRGDDLNAGAVTGVKRVRSPILLAQQVMLNSPHVMLMGSGAETFAVAQKLEMVDNDYFHTKRRHNQLQQVIAREQNASISEPSHAYEVRKFGTVGAVALDTSGTIAAATSTGGMTNKRYGRIGDSPIIGAGLYLDNEVGAAGATGRGEEILRTCGSFYVVEQMRAGKSPQEACEALCKRIVDINGGTKNIDFNDKIVAVSKSGEVGCASIKEKKGNPPKLAYWSEDGFNVYDGTYLIEE